MSVALLMPLQYFLNYKHYKNIALFDIKQLAVAKSRCLFQMPRRAISWVIERFGEKIGAN